MGEGNVEGGTTRTPSFKVISGMVEDADAVVGHTAMRGRSRRYFSRTCLLSWSGAVCSQFLRRLSWEDAVVCSGQAEFAGLAVTGQEFYQSVARSYHGNSPWAHGVHGRSVWWKLQVGVKPA